MPQPEQLPKPNQELRVSSYQPSRSRPLKMFGLIALCVVSSVVSSWLLLASGVIKPDATKTITENREKLVLQEGEIVADVFKKVSPSTVSITIEAMQPPSRVFGATVQTGVGSGIIISKDGYILTNKHVVPEGTSQVTVILADGRELKEVGIVGRDPFNDVAFLKINGEKGLPFAQIGDSSLVEPGQKVVAIGNALGEFRNSVTAGIISGLGRPIQTTSQAGDSSEKLENLFQTDAAINPGNSGGPLVNLKGEVVGINTAVAENAQGIGFAIPVNDAKGLIRSVLEKGKIVKPYLGVRYITLDRETAKQLNLPVTEGAYVNAGPNASAIIPGSPADKAGIRNGDVITKVDGQALTQQRSLSSNLAKYTPGDKLMVTIIRDGKEQTTTVTLEPYPGL